MAQDVWQRLEEMDRKIESLRSLVYLQQQRALPAREPQPAPAVANVVPLTVVLPAMPPMPPMAALALRTVAQHTGVAQELIAGITRTGRASLARAVWHYVMREAWRPQYSYPAIAKQAGRDHSTIVHSVKTIAERMRREASFATTIQRILDDVRRQSRLMPEVEEEADVALS